MKIVLIALMLCVLAMTACGELNPMQSSSSLPGTNCAQTAGSTVSILDVKVC